MPVVTIATAKKIAKEIKELRKDVAILKAAVLARDPEGDYRPEFIREIQRLAKQKPTRVYKKGVFSK